MLDYFSTVFIAALPFGNVGPLRGPSSLVVIFKRLLGLRNGELKGLENFGGNK